MKYLIDNKLNEDIINFIQLYNFELPKKNSLVISVYDKNDVINGVGVIQNVNLIEPFICKNPLSANNLYQRLETLVQLNGNDLYVLTKDEKMDNLLNKLGYFKLNNYTIWRKRWD